MKAIDHYFIMCILSMCKMQQCNRLDCLLFFQDKWRQKRKGDLCQRWGTAVTECCIERCCSCSCVYLHQNF